MTDHNATGDPLNYAFAESLIIGFSCNKDATITEIVCPSCVATQPPVFIPECEYA